MPFEEGNNWWEARSTHGRKPIWSDPAELQRACFDYFEWVEANPLTENKVFQYEGAPVYAPVEKMRAMTKHGLCVFLGISRQTWDDYAEKDDFMDIVSMVNDCIRDQKFSGAAAGLLNSNIIAREIGLAEKTEHELGSGGRGKVKWEVEFVNAEEKPNGASQTESESSPGAPAHST